ncbi:hypothetical protein L6259_03460, partial [Candidatus Parcubacteria bacterium]|nr:hypothetical protein [Candidatus Parcubacteria bacterium]
MQIKRLITIFVIALVALLPNLGVNAANYNDFQTDDDLIVGSDVNLIIKSGSTAESVTFDTGDLSITVGDGSYIRIESPDRRTLTPSDDFSSAIFHCPASGNSYLIITGSASETGTVSPSTTVCGRLAGDTGGGGGGGGAPAPSVITPTNASISIAAGASENLGQEAQLTLNATNATQMLVSNNADFSGASWESYSASKTWTLSSGLGKKTVYVKYRSSTGHDSSVVSDEIMLLPAKAVENITATAGVKIGLSDNLVSVDVPANAVTMNSELAITPTASYVAPSAGKKVVSSRVYNMEMKAGETTLTSFDKDLTLTFKYTDADLSGLLASTLAVYYWDETSYAWVKVGGTVDTANKTVTAKVNHFTTFALLADTDTSAPAVGGDLVKLK